ncbi:MAG TPA: hypothetical protein VN493_17390 [Thermoanaerobaculia bacterium]|nr:hypothetical protein [Thermoanaerobaculia bacterium]
MILRSPMRLLAVVSLQAALGLAAAGAQAVPGDPEPTDPQPVCPAVINPIPSGPNQAPPDTFADPALFPSPAFSNDYHWMHSSVHLQGSPMPQKWGACVFFNPDADQTAPVDMSDFRSAVVVNNPSPTVTLTATITYRDPLGNTLGAPLSITLGPEDTFVQGAIQLRQFGPGIGSVEVTANHPIVGATLHHFRSLTLSNGETYSDPDAFSPGEGSLQQLQMSQDSATTLFAGPFPASNSAAEDFLNGVLPLTCVMNPNPTPTTVTVNSVIAPATPLTSQTVTLAPFGMFLDTSIWAAAEPFYLTNPAPFDLDVLTAATSNGNPIIGDFLMVDVFGNGGASNLVPGGRLRMGSGMMQFSPALRLLNPEHTETGPFALPGPLPSTPPVETMMGIANATGVDIGPVRVQFFARTGGPAIAAVNIPSLPPGAVQRITPALFPIPQNFAGWARITACRPGLIGWTMREVMQQTGPAVAQFRKVYGEELDGANVGEPGRGFTVTTTDGTWIRKVAPLLRAAGNSSFPNWWPGYVNGVNHANANIGQYWHRFFTLPGTLAGQATFTGLRFANTSFTYVDPIVNLIGANSNLSGRFDRLTGNAAIGMEAIGDPLDEWAIPLFLGFDVEQALETGVPH